MNIKDPGCRLLRWRIKLEEYDYEIVYKKGALNTNAGALSRISGLVLEDEEHLEDDISSEKKRNRYCTNITMHRWADIAA
jgi:hypothetical protein